MNAFTLVSLHFLKMEKDIVMTTQQPNTASRTMTELWNELNFAGKEFCTLNEGNELMLNATQYSPERKLAVLQPENFEAVLAALTEKFAEISGKIEELEREWLEQEEKVKIAGKVYRIKDYLHRANALGDYAPLYEELIRKERELQQLYDANYAEKLKLVEKAEAHSHTEEWKAATEAFRLIIEAWKESPPIDRRRNEELWSRIEQARNHFYERKRQHQEEVGQDMMQNLDRKLELCEKSESLASSDNWKKTPEIYKVLIEEWKTIGKVASADKNEELWQRFITAQNVFFDRKKRHFEHIQREQEANHALKLAVIEKAEAICTLTDWKAVTIQMSQLMEEWKSIGRVPLSQADALWSRFQQARDTFFNAKRQNTEEIKVNLEDNYAQKTVLLQRAEALKTSTDWRETSDEMNELMAEWKKVGRVSRVHEDRLWERFLAARKYFFERKDADRDKRKARFHSQLDNRWQQTKQFLHKIKAELEEEEEKLVDFKESLSQTTGSSAKEIELRQHLENLIRQIEIKIPERKEKIEEVAQQFTELDAKRTELKKSKEA